MFYVRYNGTSWSAPVTITDSIAVGWNRFDAFVDTAGQTYIAYMKYQTPAVPVLKMMKDLQPAQTVSLNLAAGDTLNYFRLHCNAKGLFTMYLYLNRVINPNTQVTFSHDALHWTDPIPIPADIKRFMGGVIVKTDTRRGYFTDYCKQMVATAGPRRVQPYGPDTLFYGSIQLLETLVSSKAEFLSDKIILTQNYPNPFTETTTIQFNLPESTFITLRVFNASGKAVATLVNGYKSSGTYKTQFDASSLPGGVFFYTLQAGNFVKTQKMIFIK